MNRPSLAVILALVSACATAAEAGPKRVLFVGNSYSLYNDLPGRFARLAGRGGQAVETATIARNGASLDEHWNEGRVVAALDEEHWDHVVLQERSSIARGAATRFAEVTGRLTTAARKRVASVTLYATPANAGRIQDQAGIDAAYCAVARPLGVRVAPVGHAFALWTRRHPEITLHAEDGVHPNILGTELAARVFHLVLLGALPIPEAGDETAALLDATAREAVDPDGGHTWCQRTASRERPGTWAAKTLPSPAREHSRPRRVFPAPAPRASISRPAR